MGYSQKQIDMLNRGIALNMDLDRIRRDPDFIAASQEHAKNINDTKLSWRADQFLSGNNHGPFTSAEERERAFSQKARDPHTGQWKPLAELNPQYQIALEHKTAQTSSQIMGLYVAPDPLSPANMIQEARRNLYQETRNALFDKAASKDKLVAAQAQLDILSFGTDPQYDDLRHEFEATERETKPMEQALKDHGPQRIQLGATQADADAANFHNATVRPGGVGSGPDARGEANVII